MIDLDPLAIDTPVPPVLGEAEKLRVIEDAIAEIRPAVQADGGDIAFVSFDGRRVRVRLSGSCTTCAMSTHTLGGLRRRLMPALGPIFVVPAD